MKALRRAALLLLALLAACATGPGAGCGSGQQGAEQELLYFGTAMPDGTVSADDWRVFLDTVVTPRFPEGLSVWPVAGQWKSGAGPVVREASFVLNLVHPEGANHDAAIGEIVAHYKARFRQEAVLRVRSPACISF